MSYNLNGFALLFQLEEKPCVVHGGKGDGDICPDSGRRWQRFANERNSRLSSSSARAEHPRRRRNRSARRRSVRRVRRLHGVRLVARLHAHVFKANKEEPLLVSW